MFIFQHRGMQPIFLYKTKNLFQNCNEWLGDPLSFSEAEKKILVELSAEIIKHEIETQHYETKE